MLKDEGFSLPTPSAASARKCAASLLAWIGDHTQLATTFAFNLVRHLNHCFEHSSAIVKIRTKREKMWGSYHAFTCSDDFKREWKDFLVKQVDLEEASPILYQYITDKIMELLIEDHFPIVHHACTELPKQPDYLETNAIRYMAGYVIKSLLTKVKRFTTEKHTGTTRKKYEELKLCLMDLVESSEGDVNGNNVGSY